MLTKGSFLLDIEVELAWGVIDKNIDTETLRKTAQRVRNILDDILLLLETYQIPVTWGVTGHLILDHCERFKGTAHPEMPRPKYKWLDQDWYLHDPCTRSTNNQAFYGKDITDKIVDYVSRSRIPHDIACHSFSHQLFGDPDCTEEVAEAEIKRCIQLMHDNYKTRPEVFIFPRNYPGHYSVLKKNGIVAFRGPIPQRITYLESGGGIGNSAKKYASLLSYWMSFYVGIPPPVASPSKEHSLVNIAGSMCYNKKPFIPLKLIVHKAKRGLDRAIKEKKIFHMYTHLVNFGETSNEKAFLNGFEEILSYAYIQNKNNTLEAVTIKKIARESS